MESGKDGEEEEKEERDGNEGSNERSGNGGAGSPGGAVRRWKADLTKKENTVDYMRITRVLISVVIGGGSRCIYWGFFSSRFRFHYSLTFTGSGLPGTRLRTTEKWF